MTEDLSKMSKILSNQTKKVKSDKASEIEINDLLSISLTSAQGSTIYIVL